MCVCVCVYVCVCVCVWTYICMCVYVCVCQYISCQVASWVIYQRHINLLKYFHCLSIILNVHSNDLNSNTVVFRWVNATRHWSHCCKTFIYHESRIEGYIYRRVSCLMNCPKVGPTGKIHGTNAITEKSNNHRETKQPVMYVNVMRHWSVEI